MSKDTSPLKSGKSIVDPEVNAKPERRVFTAEYKRRILAEADACTEPGQLGALLRREALYASYLIHWRQQLSEALSPKKRGPKINPLAAELASAHRRIEHLEVELKRAEIIIEVQKKISNLLGLTPKSEEPQ